MIDDFKRDNPGAVEDPVNTLKPNFFDKDPNRFDVGVKDPMQKGQGQVTVHIWTTSDSTGRDVVLPELSKHPGIIRASHWFILTSNTVDTKAKSH